jgi:hypothetical protein
MNVKLRGTLCGVGAAVFYGTNPLGAMNLYHDGISANSTLFYRFGLAIVMLGVMMLVQRKKFGVTRSESETIEKCRVGTDTVMVQVHGAERISAVEHGCADAT